MTSSHPILLEVCLASVEDALTAQRCGADRIELNCALELGGLTPSIGMLAAIKQSVDIPVIVMVRPRAGDFCYDAPEFDVMLRDMDLLRENSADGFAFGG